MSFTRATSREQVLGLLQKCIKSKDLDAGKRLHSRIVEQGWLQDSYIANLLIQMYGYSGGIDNAYSLFRNLRHRNMISWNLMIKAFAHNGHLQKAQSIFFEAPKRDIVTWNSILSVSAQSSQMTEAWRIFDKMPGRDVVSSNAILSAFAKAGHLHQASRFFNQMPERNTSSWNNMLNAYLNSDNLHQAKEFLYRVPLRDVVAWSALIQAYVLKQLIIEAEALFKCMEKPDVMTCTSMIVGYGSIGRISDAYDLFVGMSERDTVCWNAMIQAFAENSCVERAREIFDATPSPNLSTFNTMIAAYAQQGLVEQASELFYRTKRRNVVTWTAMMNAYGQAGNLEEARRILHSMPEPNTIAWSTMITAYSQHGECIEALRSFRLMDLDGFPPTRVTYVSVFYACSELTELRVGRMIHADVKELYPKLYLENYVGNSIIHLYCRCGKLVEARQVFDEMINRCTVSWNTLISGYSKAGLGSEALELFELMNLDGGAAVNETTFLSVLFACSHSGLLETARSYFCALSVDYELEAIADHYVCVVDLLARAGKMDKAEELMTAMPYEPDGVAYTTYVTACKSNGMEIKASSVAKQILDLTPDDATGYVLLCNFNRPDFVKLSQEMFTAR